MWWFHRIWWWAPCAERPVAGRSPGEVPVPALVPPLPLPLPEVARAWLAGVGAEGTTAKELTVLRISEMREGKHSVLKLEGQLIGSGVDELQETCAELSEPFVLDLSDVGFIDNVGVDLVRRLAKEGAMVAGVSLFISELLKGRES